MVPDKPPLVSIIITNHNYALFLTTCIRSALSQQYPSFEVIVVDDGSTDGSREIIAGFTEVQAFHVANQGQAGAFRTGLAHAHGDIIYSLDSDDFLHPDALATITALWSSDVAAVAGRLRVVRGQDDTPTAETVPASYRPGSGSLDFMVANGFVEAATTSGMAFSRELAQTIARDALNMTWNGIDAYLTYSAPLFGRLVQTDKVLGCYRIHGKNVSLASEKSVSGLQAHVYYQYWAQMTFRKLARDRLGLEISGPPRGAFLLQWLIMTADFPAGRFPVPLTADFGLAVACARAFMREKTISALHRARNAIFILVYSVLPKALRIKISRALYA